MLANLPATAREFANLGWDDIKPYFDELIARPLTDDNAAAWLADWTRLHNLIDETFQRMQVATTLDTTDTAAEEKLIAYMENVYPHTQTAEQALKEKFLGAEIEVPGMELPLKYMQAEASIFREANIPLKTEEQKLGLEYNKTIGAQSVHFNGQDYTLSQLKPFLQGSDRAVREEVWRLSMQRYLQDRDAINALWSKFMGLRKQIARNADLPTYRDYVWKSYLRFDYTPDDCKRFHSAIEQVVVPAAARIFEKRRQKLGVPSLRPWDVDGEAPNTEPLHPFEQTEKLEALSEQMFYRLDPALGQYMSRMRNENLLDLSNRKGKAPGGYCTYFPVDKTPFIFMNAVGIHDDVQTLLHEAGHCFHAFESSTLPYWQQTQVGLEFAEVASMSMELLAAPYLNQENGGFYTSADAARARVEHLEGMLVFWPYMAVVDAFQQWVYENHDAATNPANCDAKWLELWGRFKVGEDWSGLETEAMTGWHRKLHIHLAPLYYIEYGVAQLGAAQVWANSLKDQAGALAAYRRALALGGTVGLRELFQAAGAKLAFDADTLGKSVALIEKTITELESQYA